MGMGEGRIEKMIIYSKLILRSNTFFYSRKRMLGLAMLKILTRTLGMGLNK